MFSLSVFKIEKTIIALFYNNLQLKAITKAQLLDPNQLTRAESINWLDRAGHLLAVSNPVYAVQRYQRDTFGNEIKRQEFATPLVKPPTISTTLADLDKAIVTAQDDRTFKVDYDLLGQKLIETRVGVTRQKLTMTKSQMLNDVPDFLMGNNAVANNTVSLLFGKLPNKDVLIEFEEHLVMPNGDCGFIALGVNRKRLVETLLLLKDNEADRNFLAKTIENALRSHDVKPPNELGAQFIRAIYKEQKKLDKLFSKIRDTLVDNHAQSLDINQLIIWLHKNNDSSKATILNDQTLALYKAEQQLESYCQRSQVFEHYLKTLMSTNLWLDYKSALLYAKQAKIALYIWTKKEENASQLVLFDHYCSTDSANSAQNEIHILFTNGFTHFNLLSKTTNKYSKTIKNASETILERYLKSIPQSIPTYQEVTGDLSCSYQYSANQKQIAITYENNTTAYRYWDARGLLVAETGVPRQSISPQNITTTLIPLSYYGVNVAGQRVQVTRFKEGTASASPSILPPAAITIDPDDQQELLLYDNRGLTIYKQDANGCLLGFTHTATRQLARKWNRLTNWSQQSLTDYTKITHIDENRFTLNALRAYA